MRQIIIDFPKQLKAGLDAAKDIKIDGGFDNIIVCGMGGSAMPGALLKIFNFSPYGRSPAGGQFFSLRKIPYGGTIFNNLYIHRNYGLPPQANENSLIVCISYSGDTEEPISAYEEAVKRGYKIVAIATGGKLANLCEKNGTPWAKIPPEPKIPPRSAVGYQFAALIGVLKDYCGNAVLDVAELAQTLKSENLENQGKEIAKQLVGKIPIIYSSEKWGALAYSWKTNLNENSKTHAFYNVFPEFNHNELNGYAKVDNPEKFYVIILRDSEDHPRVLKRMETAADIIKSKNIKVDFVDTQGKDILTKIFNTYILGLWVSYFLALERKIDPIPVDIIEEFKSRIAERITSE